MPRCQYPSTGQLPAYPSTLSSNIRLAKLLDILLGVRVVDVARSELVTLLLVDVEGVTVVVAQGEALLDAVDQIGRGDETTSEDDGDVVVVVLLVHSLDGTLGGETTGDEDGLLAAPRLQGKVEALVLGVNIDDTAVMSVSVEFRIEVARG